MKLLAAFLLFITFSMISCSSGSAVTDTNEAENARYYEIELDPGILMNKPISYEEAQQKNHLKIITDAQGIQNMSLVLYEPLNQTQLKHIEDAVVFNEMSLCSCRKDTIASGSDFTTLLHLDPFRFVSRFSRLYPGWKAVESFSDKGYPVKIDVFDEGLNLRFGYRFFWADNRIVRSRIYTGGNIPAGYCIYSYDPEKGRLTERTEWSAGGKLLERIEFSYKRKLTTIRYYNPDGTLTRTDTWKYFEPMRPMKIRN